ncbi:hypothetical protein Poli38472_011574 [Pythium oligandrum]|uniref:Protein kinase domain-containing protein n=1 Tax=Pythium oligandrum TaxID=41045 RepID=A0A8K1FKY9_PYTOL|nr:hypothetical protein Poli38472_011574 [Pythium oligandrum]|eukprot:TMW64694.1 hypothetical protein Poli38472_011574 [Pythium oligandrum]
MKEAATRPTIPSPSRPVASLEKASGSKLQSPRIKRQHRIHLRPAVDGDTFISAEDDDDDDGQNASLSCSDGIQSSLRSPTPAESSSCSSAASPSTKSETNDPIKRTRPYIRKEKIGQGAQGSVYRCLEVATGREVAAKVIMTYELSSAELEAIKREVKTIKQLQHRHLVQYYRATEKKSKELIIYMEYVSGGSLSAKLRQDGALALPRVKQFTRQLCEALQYLHQRRLAHRDIKCANVFLDASGEEIKLGDFGNFKEIGSVSLVGGLKGTPHWMAPEVIREQQTSEDGWFKADIWSLGCAVIEMLTGHSPWQQYSNPLTAMYQIVSSNNIPTIPADATDETASFLKLCLQRNPDDRATTSQLLAHEFLHVVDVKRKDSEANIPAQASESSDLQPKSGASPQRGESHIRKIPSPSTRTTPARPNHPALGAPSPGHRQKQLSPEMDDASCDAIKSPAQRPRKVSQIPRLMPLELIKTPSNQDHELHPSPPPSRLASNSLGKPQVTGMSIARGVSAGKLPHSHKGSLSPGVLIAPVRLRRISTAPHPSRDPEDIMSSASHQLKPKLPPLSARTHAETSN